MYLKLAAILAGRASGARKVNCKTGVDLGSRRIAKPRQRSPARFRNPAHHGEESGGNGGSAQPYDGDATRQAARGEGSDRICLTHFPPEWSTEADVLRHRNSFR